MMDAARAKKPSKLLNANLRFEARDDFEEKLENGFNMVQGKLGGLGEKEAHDALMALASANEKSYDMVSCGLLYGVLTDPQKCAKYFRDLSFITNDGWHVTLCNVNIILIELFGRLRDDVREQVIWFFKEAIRANVPKIDNVLPNLIRNINDGGDFGQVSRLANAVLGILDDNREWIRSLKKATAAPVALLAFSRLIGDQMAFPAFDNLRTREIKLCEFLVREKFSDCVLLGRDLLLAIMRLSKTPEFEAIWKDLIYAPAKFAPNFGGVIELMYRPCTPYFFHYRTSITIFRKIDFIINKVKLGNHERHLEWLRKQHLSGIDGGSLRGELVRVLSTIIVPDPNAAVDPLARAVIISWLMPTSLSPAEMQWCKLMLFWDWFGFDPATTHYSVIEPAYNMIRHALSTQPPIANGLVDFLCRSIHELYPPIAPKLLISVNCAFKCLVDQSVTSSLSTVLENVRLDKSVREMLRENFKDLMRPVQAPPTLPAELSTARATPPPIINLEEDLLDMTGSFSDDTKDDDDVEDAAKARSGSVNANTNKLTAKLSQRDRGSPSPARRIAADIGSDYGSIDEDEGEEPQEVDMTPFLASIREEFRDAVENLHKTPDTDTEERCEMVQKLLLCIFENDDDFDDDQAELIAECLCYIFSRQLRKKKILPSDPTEENVDESFAMPLFTIFRNLCMTPDSDPSRNPLLSIVAEMLNRCNKIGYLLLYFMKAGRRDSGEESTTAYADLCRVMDESVDQRLVKDLRQCHLNDYRLFGYLVPYVYANFQQEAMQSTKLLRLVCGSIDATQLLDMVGEAVRENMSIFRKDYFTSLITASLEWETIEQFFFWQLMHAEDVPVEWVLPIVHKLEYPKHAEAMTQILLMLKRMDRDPTMTLVRNMFSREPSHPRDLFTVHALKILVDDNDVGMKLADLIAGLIGKLITAGDLTMTQAKSKRTSQRYVCLEHVFAHLDKFRQTCLTKESRMAESFLSRESLQDAFTKARKSDKLSSLRIRFSELFAVMEILNDDSASSSRTLRRARGKSSHAAAGGSKGPKDESSDDESAASKPKRKRPKIVVDSDSD